MKILELRPIGYQEVICNGEKIFQIRFVGITEPFGDFVSDPDGDVSEIKLIDPNEYKQYFNWGAVGDRIMEQALERYKEGFSEISSSDYCWEFRAF